MKFSYGIIESFIDVSEICTTRLKYKNTIIVPFDDCARAAYFTDPNYGYKKTFFIQHDDDHTDAFGEEYAIIINSTTNEIRPINIMDINSMLSTIHSGLTINYGSFSDEYPEQRMAAMFLSGNEKVLEIGGNIGRNSLIISTILGPSNGENHVVLESDTDISIQLQENRDINNLNFRIENSALSKRKLIQSGWNTVESDTLLDGYKWVNTITWDELNAKYNIAFDTLVLDCEGAFYYILMDMPEILQNIQLVIMENDYTDITHKEYVDSVLSNNNFELAYVEGGGWGPCKTRFFEVWKRA